MYKAFVHLLDMQIRHKLFGPLGFEAPRLQLVVENILHCQIVTKAKKKKCSTVRPLFSHLLILFDKKTVKSTVFLDKNMNEKLRAKRARTNQHFKAFSHNFGIKITNKQQTNK